MGRSCIIMACAIAHKEAFLSAAGLVDTGAPDPEHETAHSGASDGKHFFLWRNPMLGNPLRRLDLKSVSRSAPFYHTEIVSSVDGAATKRFEGGKREWWIEGGKTGYAEIGTPPFTKDDLIGSWKTRTAAAPDAEPDAFALAAEAFVLASGLHYENEDHLAFTALDGQFPYAKPWWKIW